MHRFVLSLLLLLSTAASAAAQRPDSAPVGPITLLPAIERGRRQGVNDCINSPVPEYCCGLGPESSPQERVT